MRKTELRVKITQKDPDGKNSLGGIAQQGKLRAETPTGTLIERTATEKVASKSPRRKIALDQTKEN